MNQDSLVLVLTIFVGLVALSQLAQLVAIVLIQRNIKALQDKVDPLIPRVQSLVDSAKSTVDQGGKQVLDITVKTKAILEATNAILDSIKVQMGRVDTVVADATARTKAQLERIDLVLEDAVERFHDTVAATHGAVRRPLREINGVSAGVKAAVAHMMRGNRPNVSQATHDEEMFI